MSREGLGSDFMNTGRTSEVLSFKTMDVCGYLHLHRMQKRRRKFILPLVYRSEGWVSTRQSHSWSSTTRKGPRSWKRFEMHLHLQRLETFAKHYPLLPVFKLSHSEQKTTTKAKEILDLCEIGNINALRLLRFFWKLKRWPSKITTWSTNPTCM